MKILCRKSGIEFNVTHFPGYFTNAEAEHPVFNLTLKQLWRYYPKWQERQLTETDSFLLFLAYLNSTELVDFRCHVWQRPDTARIISSNMSALHDIIGKIVTIRHPKFAVPRFVISKETRDLANVKHWIEAWQNSFSDFCNGLKDETLRERLLRKEQNLERYIKNHSLNPNRYARLLAQWTSESAEFPNFEITVAGETWTCSEYWQEIIIKCHTDTDIITVPEKDLRELIEHCEENLDGGSIQAHHLFQTVRAGLSVITGFFSLGSATFSILGTNGNEDEAVGKTNLQMLIDTAPTKLPRRVDYPTDFSYLKAKMKYQLAQNYAADSTLEKL